MRCLTMFNSVLLYTNQLKELRRFYMNILELNITDETEEAFSIDIGTSKLTFKQSDKPCFYHYAINIPGNQFSMLKHRIKERIPLNRERGIDEVYFSSFDADSMYFEDPAGNIIELIGRRKRDLFGNPTFAESFFNISEVGIVSSHLDDLSEEFQDIGLPLRGTEISYDSVNFFGREESFIVLVPPERKWYFSEQMSEVFPLEIELTNGYHITINEEGLANITKTEDD